MVGLYGDPTVSWSIVLEARLSTPVDPELVRTRLAKATAEHPHLGLAPPVGVPTDWVAARTDFADRPYADGEPLIRAAVTERRLMLAAHHGVVDGFGLLSLLGIALDAPVGSGARGIGARPARRGFLSSAVLRVLEAVFTPPSRAAPAASGGTGDALAAAELAEARIGSTALTAATAEAVRDWNQRHGTRTRRVVTALGASRRPGSALAPDRRTAFFRLRVPPGADAAAVRRLLDATPPEPDFPESRSVLMRPLIRLLSHRLGATFLVSHLGPVRISGPVTALAFYPTPTGRAGLAVGAASCGDTTTITVRARRTAFDGAAARHLLDLITTRTLPR